MTHAVACSLLTHTKETHIQKRQKTDNTEKREKSEK